MIVRMTPTGPRYCPHPQLLPYARAMVLLSLVWWIYAGFHVTNGILHHRDLSNRWAISLMLCIPIWVAISIFHTRCEWRPWSPEIKP